MHPFLEALDKRPLLFDGAMGTLLFARGASSVRLRRPLYEGEIVTVTATVSKTESRERSGWKAT